MQMHSQMAKTGLWKALIFFLVVIPLSLSAHVADDVIFRKVAVVQYDPVHPFTGQRLSDHLGWANAEQRSRQFVKQIAKVSNGKLIYEIKETIWLRKFPKKRYTNQQYTWESYLQCRSDETSCIRPDEADYLTLMVDDTNLAEKIDNKQIDEVWVWGGGYFGFDEFAFKIPDDKPNYEPIPNNDWLYELRKKNLPALDRTYFVMGWIPEVGFDNQLHSFGHRAESALALTAPGQGHWQRCDEGSAYSRYICIDLDQADGAACGDIHYPPNAEIDYDYSNLRYVWSDCHSWRRFPFVWGWPQWINAGAWCADADEVRLTNCHEKYLSWWLDHLPRNPGTNKMYGDEMKNNWWYYIALYREDSEKPDLTPTPITFEGVPIPDVYMEFDSGVSNLGGVGSGVFNIRWLVDGKDVGAYGSHENVPANTTILDGNSGFLWKAETGQHEITFIVDVDDMVDECNESNNQVSIIVNVGSESCEAGEVCVQ